MVTITFQCADAAQVRNELLKLAGVLSDAPLTTAVAEAVATVRLEEKANQMEFDLDVPEKVHAKRGRKPAKEKAAEVIDAASINHKDATTKERLTQDPAPERVVQPPGKPTREAVHTALQQVNSACGLPTARTILSEFNAQRISELKEDMFSSFIAKCSAAVEMQG